jgi:hypothetical protein
MVGEVTMSEGPAGTQCKGGDGRDVMKGEMWRGGGRSCEVADAGREDAKEG